MIMTMSKQECREVSGVIRQGGKVIQMTDDLPVKLFIFSVTKTVYAASHWKSYMCVLLCVRMCVCVCMLTVNALVSLVLGDRKCTAMRAQVPYLFLESAYACLLLVYPKGNACGFCLLHTH